MFIEKLHTTLVNRFVEKWDHCRTNCTTFLISSYLLSVTQYRSRLICHCCFPQNSNADNLKTLYLFSCLEGTVSFSSLLKNWHSKCLKLNILKLGFHSVEGMSSTFAHSNMIRVTNDAYQTESCDDPSVIKRRLWLFDRHHRQWIRVTPEDDDRLDQSQINRMTKCFWLFLVPRELILTKRMTPSSPLFLAFFHSPAFWICFILVTFIQAKQNDAFLKGTVRCI